MSIKKIVATLRRPFDQARVTEESQTLVDLLCDENKGRDITVNLYFAHITNPYEEAWLIFNPKERTYKTCRSNISPQSAEGHAKFKKFNEVFSGINDNEETIEKALSDMRREIKEYARVTKNPETIMREYEMLAEKYRTGASDGYEILLLYLSTLKSSSMVPLTKKGIVVHCHHSERQEFSSQDRRASLFRSLGLIVFNEYTTSHRKGESLDVTGGINYRRGLVEIDSAQLGEFKLHFYRPKGRFPQEGYYLMPDGRKIPLGQDFGVRYSKEEALSNVSMYPNSRFMVRFPIDGEIPPEHSDRQTLLYTQNRYYESI